ncbi:hypothetical protein EFA69_02735 [Rufibacter immobilis]|uniref:Uncharacterized protein n=1 Tax=Rufibacter immobilis TaxID=1348778 RepID=A0A3M9N381_9BACT|nr:hypothetical protein [Rufibacter immobilis]RNI32261.1 hypothetical protein EFA69_02735 [Rufibacter immobilis]
MSELNNPLFDDPREFLERQKEEYKNALLSDVTDLKDQSQKMGKNLLIAGGVLAGIYFVSRALNGGGKDKPKKKKSNRLENPARFKGAEDRAWISSIPEVEDDEPLYSAIERTYPAVYHPSTGTVASGHGRSASKEETSLVKAFFKSDLFKILEQQLAAILMVYLTKMVEKHLQAPEAPQQPVLVEETTVAYELQPDPITDAQPPQSSALPNA